MNVESKKGKDAGSPRIFTNLSRISSKDLKQSINSTISKLIIFKENHDIAWQDYKSCISLNDFTDMLILHSFFLQFSNRKQKLFSFKNSLQIYASTHNHYLGLERDFTR